MFADKFLIEFDKLFDEIWVIKLLYEMYDIGYSISSDSESLGDFFYIDNNSYRLTVNDLELVQQCENNKYYLVKSRITKFGQTFTLIFYRIYVNNPYINFIYPMSRPIENSNYSGTYTIDNYIKYKLITPIFIAIQNVFKN